MQLTDAAQNTFLKTFEEPPEYAVFIIVIENTASLLQTVLSRCTHIHFPCVSDKIVEEYIKKQYPEEQERLSFLIKYCAGVPKMADSVINDTDFELLRTASLNMFSVLFSSNKRSAFDVRKFLDENKEKAMQVLDFWLSFARDVVLMQTGVGDSIINVDKRPELRKIASSINPEEIIQIIERLVTSEKMLVRYVSLKAVSMWLVLR